MAIAVIGGLLTSTGLSLLVVPVVFSLLARERMVHPLTVVQRSHTACGDGCDPTDAREEQVRAP